MEFKGRNQCGLYFQAHKIVTEHRTLIGFGEFIDTPPSFFHCVEEVITEICLTFIDV